MTRWVEKQVPPPYLHLALALSLLSPVISILPSSQLIESFWWANEVFNKTNIILSRADGSQRANEVYQCSQIYIFSNAKIFNQQYGSTPLKNSHNIPDGTQTIRAINSKTAEEDVKNMRLEARRAKRQREEEIEFAQK